MQYTQVLDAINHPIHTLNFLAAAALGQLSARQVETPIQNADPDWQVRLRTIMDDVQPYVEGRLGSFTPETWTAFMAVMAMICPPVYSSKSLDDLERLTTDVEEPTDPQQVRMLEVILLYLDARVEALAK